MKKRILFAGAEFQQASGTCGSLNAEWEYLYAADAPAALALLSVQPCDAIVADFHLPGIDGAQLLEKAGQRHPLMLRFICAPLSDWSATMKCLGKAHQFLPKPAGLPAIHAALRRGFALQTWLPDNDALKLVAGLDRLPSPPELYFGVVAELQSPAGSIEHVGELIARDPAMTAKLLQLANSAVMGLGLEVTGPAQAIFYLGAETTKSLILLAHTFSYFDNLKPSELDVGVLWAHSLRTGIFARWIAQEEGLAAEGSAQAFTAGLLHDLGRLALAENRPRELSLALGLARKESIPVWLAERRLWGASHAEVGACLLGCWGLPASIVEAVALHHSPVALLSNGFCPLTAVHVANVIAHELAPDGHPGQPSLLDMDYLARLGLADRLDAWRQVCQRPPD